MPTILRTLGYRFFFYSLDAREPRHIHVAHGDKLAKYWLSPVEVASSEGFRAHELNRVRGLVILNVDLFREAWDEHFSSQDGAD